MHIARTHDRFDVGHETFPGMGKCSMASMAQEQVHPEIYFQIGNGRADGGLTFIQPSGCA